MSTPNLFVIGAPKAGSSTLHSLLGSHPEIFMCSPKEPGYFYFSSPQHREEAWRKCAYDFKTYLALFESGARHRYRGESCTYYARCPVGADVPPRLREFAPDARLIYIIRDPVERTISHYWWNVRSGIETRDVLTAVMNDPTYLDISNYAMQLEAYLRVFPPDQIKVVLLEELSADPRPVLADIFSWLGVDDRFAPDNLQIRENPTGTVFRARIKREWLWQLRESWMWSRIGPYTPKSFRALSRRLIERQVDRSKVCTREAEEFLRPIQREQTKKLKELLGRDFQKWTRLDGASMNVPVLLYETHQN